MLETIQRFIEALREAGLPISPAEAIDAAGAVRAVGVDRRPDVRAALRATLAKSRVHAGIFDRLFDRHFAPPREPRAPGRGRGEPAGLSGAGRHRPPDDREPGRSEPRPGRRVPALEEPQRERPRASRLRVVLAPRREIQDPRARRASAAALPSRPPAPRRGPARPSPRRQAPPVRDPKPSAGHAPASPRRVDLRLPLTRPEEEALAREVPRLVREIRLKAGRRRRRSRRGRLWAARVMRASLPTGGVPFDLPMRAPRPRRPRVVVMVDVSWSVLRASSLFLSMSRGFLARGARASVWLFVDRCVDATARLAVWKDHTPGGWAAFLEGLPDLDPRAASDYGRAFHQAFGAMGPRGARALRRDTILVVLGDARSNHRDPLSWVFEDMAARCRRVIWLDPEPAELWGTGDSALADYLPACDVVCEARDLEGIARGVAEIARAL